MYQCQVQQVSREEALRSLEEGRPGVYTSALGAGLHHTMSSSSSHVSGKDVPPGEVQQQSAGASQASQLDVPQWTPDLSYGVVLLSDNDQGLAAGQYAVFYQERECLGSAQILGGLAAPPDTLSGA